MSLTIELDAADLEILEADAREHGLPVQDWAALLLAGVNALRRREEARQDAEDAEEARRILAETPREDFIPFAQFEAELDAEQDAEQRKAA